MIVSVTVNAETILVSTIGAGVLLLATELEIVDGVTIGVGEAVVIGDGVDVGVTTGDAVDEGVGVGEIVETGIGDVTRLEESVDVGSVVTAILLEDDETKAVVVGTRTVGVDIEVGVCAED